jgi:guanylate kinase
MQNGPFEGFPDIAREDIDDNDTGSKVDIRTIIGACGKPEEPANTNQPNSRESSIPIIISGWSGSGKNTVARELQSVFNNVGFSISRFTDRQIRPGEVNGVDGFFVSKEEFRDFKSRGEFIYDYTKQSYGGVSYGFHDGMLSTELAAGNIFIVGGEISTSMALKSQLDLNATRLGIRHSLILFVDRDIDSIIDSLQSRPADPEEIERRIKHVKSHYSKPELPEGSVYYLNNGRVDIDFLRDSILRQIA